MPREDRYNFGLCCFEPPNEQAQDNGKRIL